MTTIVRSEPVLIVLQASLLSCRRPLALVPGPHKSVWPHNIPEDGGHKMEGGNGSSHLALRPQGHQGRHWCESRGLAEFDRFRWFPPRLIE